jgi:hypothetical protein
MDSSELDGFTEVGKWPASPVLPTRSSLEWFIKENRKELAELGALIPGKGRRASLLSNEKFPKAVIEILRRKAVESVASDPIAA